MILLQLIYIAEKIVQWQSGYYKMQCTKLTWSGNPENYNGGLSYLANEYSSK